MLAELDVLNEIVLLGLAGVSDQKAEVDSNTQPRALPMKHPVPSVCKQLFDEHRLEENVVSCTSANGVQSENEGY